MEPIDVTFIDDLKYASAQGKFKDPSLPPSNQESLHDGWRFPSKNQQGKTVTIGED